MGWIGGAAREMENKIEMIRQKHNRSTQSTKMDIRPLLTAIQIVALVLIGGVPVGAAENDGESDGDLSPCHISPGAYEAGFNASFLSVEGSTRADFGFRGARFFPAPRALFSVGAELTYGHISSLDEFGVEGTLGWSRADSQGGILPFSNIACGIRREWIGSFNQARYPVGGTVGLRALFSSRSAVRLEYRFRRLLNDPVADFTEHRIAAGISLFWRNS